MFPAHRLAGNRLFDEGTITICDALRESKVSKLQALDLSGNGISPAGAKSVTAYVAVTSGLMSLDVRYNPSMGDEGETVIRKAVEGREGFDLKM